MSIVFSNVKSESMVIHVFINKKTKKYAKQDNITMKFSDTDDIFEAKKFKNYSVFHLYEILRFFRIKSKYEIHCVIIKTIKSPT